MRAETKRLGAINSSVIFPGIGPAECENPAVYVLEGTHWLIAEGEKGLIRSASRDLRRWREPEELFGEVKGIRFTRPGRVAAFGGRYYFCCLGRKEEDGGTELYLAEVSAEAEALPAPRPLSLPFEEGGAQALTETPLLIGDREEREKLWCLYQDGARAASAWTKDLETWHPGGRGEFPGRVADAVVCDGTYALFVNTEEGNIIYRTKALEKPGTDLQDGGDGLRLGDGEGRPGNCPGDKRTGYSVVWDEELSLYVLYYLSGGVRLAVSKDLRYWQRFERDRATAPERGVIYDGDYYRALPFGQYLHRGELPEGKRIFDIRDYGAIPDGITLCTEPFQAAAQAAKESGGGVILVTGGHYCVGSVTIYGNTTLWIDTDSALCASKNLSNYGDAFLTCMEAENVCVTGGGRIIGNGEYFAYLPLKRPLTEPLAKTKLPPELFDPMGYPVDTIRYAYRSRIRYAEDKYAEGLAPVERPMYTVWVCGCENVTIENVVIEDALDWTLVLDGSRNVKVRDVVINGNRHVANTDGIDIMGCEEVEISHCFVSCADDGLCIKSPRRREHDGIEVQGHSARMGGTRGVHISDCTVVSVMNAFKIGTETYFDIEDVTVENCRFMLPDIFPGTVSGISIESADGARVRNVRIRDIEMERVCCPLFICLNMRNKYGFGESREERRYGGGIENIVIEGISAEEMEVPGIITGFRTMEGERVVEGRVKDIHIRDFQAVYRDNTEELHIRESVYENVRDYPENNAFGDVPAYGLYIRHGDNVTVEQCSITPRSMNTRECIVLEDSKVSLK